MHQEGWTEKKKKKKKDEQEFMVDPQKKKGSRRRISLYHPTYVKLKHCTTVSGNMSYRYGITVRHRRKCKQAVHARGTWMAGVGWDGEGSMWPATFWSLSYIVGMWDLVALVVFTSYTLVINILLCLFISNIFYIYLMKKMVQTLWVYKSVTSFRMC